MREILSIQVGQCGNTIGHKFWETICQEHSINQRGHFDGKSDLQIERINIYFNESSGGSYIPRSINVDLAKNTLEFIKNSEFGGLFKPDSFISGSQSSSNNFGKGYYTNGLEHVDEIMDAIRNEVEICDLLQGFSFFHGMGGGTGTGLTCLLLKNIRDEYSDRIISNFSVFPSPKVSETVVEPYNCVLCVPYLTTLTDETFCVDNLALKEICEFQLFKQHINNNDLNQIISLVVSGITTCLRFPGQLNTDLRKLAVNMVPFPGLHFLIPGVSPFQAKDSRYHTDKSKIRNMVMRMFNSNHLLVKCNTTQGKFFTIASIFRGICSMKEIEEEVMKMKYKNDNNYIEWIPDNIQIACCDIPPPGFKVSSTSIVNNTAIQTIFDRFLDQFQIMFKRRAFVHWYTSEGMVEEDFRSSQNEILELCEQYKMHEQNWQYEQVDDKSQNDD